MRGSTLELRERRRFRKTIHKPAGRGLKLFDEFLQQLIGSDSGPQQRLNDISTGGPIQPTVGRQGGVEVSFDLTEKLASTCLQEFPIALKVLLRVHPEIAHKR